MLADLILYVAEDGRSQIKLRTHEQTVFLMRLEMPELFDAIKQNVSLHLKSMFEDGKLVAGSVVKESLTSQTRPGPRATVKQSLTVHVEPSHAPTTRASSALHACQRGMS